MLKEWKLQCIDAFFILITCAGSLQYITVRIGVELPENQPCPNSARSPVYPNGGFVRIIEDAQHLFRVVVLVQIRGLFGQILAFDLSLSLFSTNANLRSLHLFVWRKSR